MSKPFETNVARWFHEQAPQLDLQPGDRYAAELPDRETAQGICKYILELPEDGPTSRTVKYEDTKQSVPFIEIAGTPVGVVVVRREGQDVTEPYEVSRSYATTLRNRIAEGQDDISDAALLMIYETGVLIETLDTTHTLFADDGKLPLRDFQTRILTSEDSLEKQGDALVEVLEAKLDFPADPLEDLHPLKTISEIYDACVQEDGDRLQSLIPKVGTYLTETAFDNSWFEKTESKADLKDQAEQVLQRNAKHADRIADASRVTKDTQSELGGYYEDDFIDKVLSSSDWTTITRTEAVNGEIDSSTPTGSGGGGGGGGGGGKVTTTTPDRDPSFQNISLDQEKARIYGSSAEVSGDRSVIASGGAGSFTATISYDIDVSEEPIKLIDSTGSEIDDWECDDDEITVTLEGLKPDVPHFYRLEVYVGHKTKRGTPQNRFDFALVPDWFFDALGDVTLGIDVEDDSLLVRNESSVELRPPDSDSDTNPTIVEITGDKDIELEAPIVLDPDSPPRVERMRCKISYPPEGSTPISVVFLSEVDEPTAAEVQLPLSFAALMSPADWADDETLQVNSTVVTNISKGEFHSPSRGRIEIGPDKQPLGLEKQIVEEGTIAPRVTERVELGIGITDEDALDAISADLIAAYTELFNHFEERDTIPSTDQWDAATQEKVTAVLDNYLDAIDSIAANQTALTFDPYRRLGTIRSSEANTEWLTPFHPMMLAYALRVSQWRDGLVDQGLIEGFRFNRFRSLFNPVGLNPFRWDDSDSGKILSGQKMGNNHLWAKYTLVEGPQSDTPDYISDVVKDKLKSFVTAFPLLFKLHTERELNINLINMGDLGPVIEGLYEFFDFILDQSTWNLPQINLQIYGGPGEGRTLERFFATDTADSPVRDQLSTGKHDEIIEKLDQRVTYIRAGPRFDEEHRRPAHLTFFRGILDEQPGAVATEGFPKATRLDGLLPRDQIKIDSTGGSIVSRSGAAFDPSNTEMLNRIGAAINTLEASARDNEFTNGRTLSKVVKTSSHAGLQEIWDQSLWVLHVEPKVDLDFYIRSTAKASDISEDTLMIHYSDQYDAASPGFDVITTTNKRDPYVQALQKALNETTGLDAVDPESVLTRLVAIDGELALEIQQAEGKKTVELLGLVGGLAVSGEILASELPEYEWIPISLDEFARHDRTYRSDEQGLLQYIGGGKASDDLCFVGVPKRPDVDQLTLQLWIVETKGGSSNIKKGVEQIHGAREKITELFEPEDGFGDTEVLRSEFGEVVLQIARRLSNYQVISEERFETVEQHAERLADGDYDLELLEDAQKRVGEVIRIQRNIALPDVDTKDDVRVLKLPTDVLALINQDTLGETQIHEDLNRAALSFTNSSESNSTTSDDSEEQTDTEAVTDEEPKEGSEAGMDPATPTDGSDDSEPVNDGSAGENDTHPDDNGDASSNDTATEKDTSQDETADTATIESEGTNDTESADEDTGHQDVEPTADSMSNGQQYDWTEATIESLTTSLEASPEQDISIDISRLTSDLKEQFESLGINVYETSPSDVSIGPRKIGINVTPKSGQKIEKILNALDSVSVHIQASGTITGVSNPKEGAVRLEIPHDEPRDIHVRDGFEALGETLRDPLHIPLGVTTENEHVTIDLLEEHHALIGGATGSGKSNFLATVICSLAVNFSPSQVRLSLLDPKGIDFGRFEDFPQVDTYIDNPEDCVEYLRSLLESELETRREKLQESGASSVEEYNRLAESRDRDPIPYRVIVIDEFADLVMSLSDSQDEFEEAVGRLAQIGRALGYSILLATQRPDADIVSGKIKTNFNCRISFELPSNTDSRVILDRPGAEDLQGAGDMIALTSGGDEYHLQSYLLLPEDALTIREYLS